MSSRHPILFLAPAGATDRRILRVLFMLEENLQLRAAQLAPQVGLTESYLEHLFKKQIGMTIGEYAMGLRLARACHLLATTFKSLKQIRNEVGIPMLPISRTGSKSGSV